MSRAHRTLSLAFSGALLVATGCAPGQAMSGDSPTSSATDGGTHGAQPDAAAPPDNVQLGLREINLGLALRTAAIKLVGDLPTLDEQRAIQLAPSPRAAYEKQIDAYLADPRFVERLVAFFRNTFKMGGDLPVGMAMVSLETAPTFAAEVVNGGRPFWDVLTASSNTCPTLDAATGAFTDAACGNGAPKVAGVLTDPGVQAQFVSNLAFRRVRWLQETFDCRKFPTEYGKAPVVMGAGQYTSPWPFDSISGGANVPVDFHDTKSVVCANCHSTMNHLAPLFANFDRDGNYQNTIQVTVPVKGLPKAKLTDWLPMGEETSWRFGVVVTDLPSLGQAMAKDPEVNACIVARTYNWAMSKDDVVSDLATVPDVVLAPYAADFAANGQQLKKTLRKIITSDDFVKF